MIEITTKINPITIGMLRVLPQKINPHIVVKISEREFISEVNAIGPCRNAFIVPIIVTI